MGEYLLFTERDILERVDEYLLYCHYMQSDIVIGADCISPVRAALGKEEERYPSFAIYERRRGNGPHEFMWKDNGTGAYGDIFDLVKLLLVLTSRKEAMFRIMADFAIGGTLTESLVTKELPKIHRKYAEPTDIDIKSRLFDRRDDLYWGLFNVERELLKRYGVKPLSCYWLTEKQKTPMYPKGLGYAYQIWDKYKLYFPSQIRHNKFRTNYNEACLEGFQQLEYNSPLLLITKSTKDVMCLRSFGYEAVSPRGESILVPEPFLNHFKEKYRRILILFDNDMKHRGDEYEFDKIYVPLGDKDTSDFCKAHGPKETSAMLQQIIGA